MIIDVFLDCCFLRFLAAFPCPVVDARCCDATRVIPSRTSRRRTAVPMVTKYQLAALSTILKQKIRTRSHLFCSVPQPILPRNAMSLSYWARACATAVDRPLQAQLDSAYASCGVTVSVAAGVELRVRW
jgi:hypothetical protein